MPSSAYATRPISSPPSAQPQPHQQQQQAPPSASAYPQSSSPPYNPTPAAAPVNNAAYRPGSSGGPQTGGTVTGAPQQRPYQPMAGPPPLQTTIPQNPQPQPGGGAPLLRRMDSRSSISAPGGGQLPPNAPGQQHPQLNRPPLQAGPPNMMPRPPNQQQQNPQPMFRPQPPGTGQQQFQKFPPNFQQQQQQQQQRPPMMMRPPQMGPNGQPLPQQMRPQFPGPRPGGPNPNQQPPLRSTMQTPGQYQPRMPEDQRVLDSHRPSSRNGKLSSLYDDDDDVVIGRAVTPNYQPRPNGPGMPGGGLPAKGPMDPQLLSRPPSQQGKHPIQFQQSDINRSMNSRPPSRPQSRPPSGPDNPSSPSPEGMMKQGVNFLDPIEANKSGINLRSIPELGGGRDSQLGGQQFRVGQMVNKPPVPSSNFQSSSVNLNAILNVDRSRPLSRDLPPNSPPHENLKKTIDASGLSKKRETL